MKIILQKYLTRLSHFIVNRGTLSILNMIIILLTYIWATLSIPYMIFILQTIIWVTLSILNMIMILLKFIWGTLSILNMIIILQKIPNIIPLYTVNRGALSILQMIIILLKFIWGTWYFLNVLTFTVLKWHEGVITPVRWGVNCTHLWLLWYFSTTIMDHSDIFGYNSFIIYPIFKLFFFKFSGGKAL